MKNNFHIFLLACCLLMQVSARAQQFFFSAELPASCASADGIITLVPTRGIPPFTYLWSTGASTVSIHGVPKGVYSATLTDATGSSVVHTHHLNSRELDLRLTDSKPATFCNPVAGALSVAPLGGAAPYTYVWNNGQSDATAQGLQTGIYSVTVQDANGCTASGEYEVGFLQQNYWYDPKAEIETISEPDCLNSNQGELKAVMGRSGYGPYTYLWSTGATQETAAGLATADYAVTVTDALGCARAATVTLRNALPVTGAVICNGTNSGTATANLVNATGPVQYLWSNNQSGPSLSNLPPGQYGVTASDANGCSSTAQATVKMPVLSVYDFTPKCYAGNNGVANAWVNGDMPASFLWDNGETEHISYTLSPGPHTVTVTTALGCTLTGSVNIPAPLAPPIEISYSPSPANCANGTGGSLNVTLTGGIPPYNFYAYGPEGFTANNLAALQNVEAGQYYLSVNTQSPGTYCAANAIVNLSDASGFNPELQIVDVDCVSGFGSAEIVNVTAPDVQYAWSTGHTTSSVGQLTTGCYSLTLTGQGSCVKYFDFCLYGDSLQVLDMCTSQVSGTLFNDLGAPGCNGTTGIPFQLIRTLPSGALHFTDQHGAFSLNLPFETFDVQPAGYDLADIACPPGGVHSVTPVAGSPVAGLDFHFYHPNPSDYSVRHKALRTAQPGYPYSVRIEVCNDGAGSNGGAVGLEYGSFFGSIGAGFFAQHNGAFSFQSETVGTPNREADFNFPAIAPGGCELFQIDFQTPTNAAGGMEFITRATVTPLSGDPTPANNVSTIYNTVVGSYDPNAVYAYPARNGNPHDGGDILHDIDRSLTYQIVFQNTGTAPADLVVVRDTLDEALEIASIRNITASHPLKVDIEGDNKVLVFRFEHINLPDSLSDYANSIGSIQYEIDLRQDVAVGTEIEKSAAIYFDFNSPVITNRNRLTVTESSQTVSAVETSSLRISPNPASGSFRVFSEKGGQLGIFNALGGLVGTQTLGAGQQQIGAAGLTPGVYFIRLEEAGRVQSGKIVIE